MITGTRSPQGSASLTPRRVGLMDTPAAKTESAHSNRTGQRNVTTQEPGTARAADRVTSGEGVDPIRIRGRRWPAPAAGGGWQGQALQHLVQQPRL